MRHFLSAGDVSAGEQSELIERAVAMKAGSNGSPLEGKAVGLLFEKPSTRTRVSFEVAVAQLGGHPVVLRSEELQLGRGEPIEDTARVLSRYLDAMVIRTFEQSRLESFAGSASISVINALSDLEHPCQALADLMTIQERLRELSSVRLAYLGDGNNVAHSLLLAGAQGGLARIAIATPVGYEPDPGIVERSSASPTEVVVTNDPSDAIKSSNVLYTDVWASMGQESERAARLEAFAGFSLDAERVAEAEQGAIVMHCLPAHRGEEISDEVISSDASVVWDQAENRLHTQKALLEFLVR